MRSPFSLHLALCLAAAGLCALLFSGQATSSAQDGLNVTAVQTAAINYGTSITFAIRGSSNDPVSDTLLHIHIRNQADSDVRPEAFSGGTDYSASVSIPISALHLPSFAQITYNWEVKTASGIANLTDVQSLLYEDNTLPWTWSVESRDNLVVHWDGQDSNLANIALATANDASARLANLTGARPAGPVHIYVYPDLSSLAGSLRRNQQRVQDWVAAYSVPDQNGIFVAANSGTDAIPNLERDLTHELTHLFVYSATSQNPGKVPGWLNEGLALTSADDVDTSLDAELDEAVHDGVLLSLNDLCAPGFSVMPPHDAALAYAQSASFVRYIEARYGNSQIKGLLAAYAGGASCADGVNMVLGAPLADLETQWHGDVGQSYSEPMSQELSLVPWAFAWVISLVLAYLFVFPQSPASEERPAYLTRFAVPPVSDIKHS